MTANARRCLPSEDALHTEGPFKNTIGVCHYFPSPAAPHTLLISPAQKQQQRIVAAAQSLFWTSFIWLPGKGPPFRIHYAEASLMIANYTQFAWCTAITFSHAALNICAHPPHISFSFTRRIEKIELFALGVCIVSLLPAMCMNVWNWSLKQGGLCSLIA